jgi:NADPH:quinone reductase-like Zn-dependent oxidoreductase
MKAVVMRAFGGPEVLEVVDDWPDPKLGPRDVLVAVEAVSVGRTLDVEVRRRGADFRVELPRIPGSDPAGVVVEAGAEVTSVHAGDRVVSTSTLFCGECDECRAGRTNACVHHGALGVQADGGCAELCAVPEGTLAAIPDGVGFDQAAAMGTTYPVSWNLLRHRGEVGEGDDVLVMGAGGGMGIAGVLIAKSLGARVIAAAGSEWKLDRCRELLGADATVDYTKPGWAERVRESSRDGRGVDAVFENISSPALFGGALSTLRPYGRLLTCGAHGGGTVELNVRALYRSHLSIHGDTGATQAQTLEVFRRVADGLLAPPPVFHRYPLEDAAVAQEAAAGRDLFGRAVLMVG